MKAAACILLLVVTSSGLAQAAPAVVQAGDGQMSCEQLTTEINTLNEAVAAKQQEEAKRESRARTTKGVLGGLASGALSAAPALMGGRLGGGMASQYALNGALQGIQNSAATPTTAAAAEPRPATPEQQRLDHMSELFRSKGC